MKARFHSGPRGSVRERVQPEIQRAARGRPQVQRLYVALCQFGENRGAGSMGGRQALRILPVWSLACGGIFEQNAFLIGYADRYEPNCRATQLVEHPLLRPTAAGS